MDLRLTTLGVSSASPMSDRYPSAHVLNVHGRLFLLDCGEGAQMLMARHKISHFKLADLCISHLHGDHIFGLFGLLSTMSMKGRKEPLTIYAPSGFSDIMDFIMKQFGDYLTFEIRHVRTDCDSMTLLADLPQAELYSFPLNHVLPCYGFLIRSKTSRHKSFAYCCDTAPFPEESGYIKDVDLLLHEVTFADDMEAMALQTGHSTARQAARVAAEAGVGKMIITHFSSRYKDVEVLLTEVKKTFENSFLACEGATFEI